MFWLGRKVVWLGALLRSQMRSTAEASRRRAQHETASLLEFLTTVVPHHVRRGHGAIRALPRPTNAAHHTVRRSAYLTLS